ncbi:hypothetical protein PaG_06264 [Moesziomyces aphidis]|uniref:Uncharacterized protein n=1 Tax=Moesziomyces aphidis TaxID=84754 RepID=W3VG41_MOEAP|nr:hypothetical protein PaG_06264 [Moesziomyces aphidis]
MTERYQQACRKRGANPQADADRVSILQRAPPLLARQTCMAADEWPPHAQQSKTGQQSHYPGASCPTHAMTNTPSTFGSRLARIRIPFIPPPSSVPRTTIAALLCTRSAVQSVRAHSSPYMRITRIV